MYKIYKKDEVRFAVIWIIIYCIVTIPIRSELGDENIVMLMALAAIAAGITAFIKKNDLQEKYGLSGLPGNLKRYLFFIPVWVLATGNLWGGVQVMYSGFAQVCAVISMLLIGYIEEVLFRGFLFKGMLSKDGIKKAVIISAVTFGIGHIVNLLAGQANLATVMQVFFAIAWGFIFTAVFCKSKSLVPCILAHGIVNSLSKFGKENITAEWLYIIATIVVAIVYCTYLFKLPDEIKNA